MEHQPNLTDRMQDPVDPSTNDVLNKEFLTALLHQAKSAFFLFRSKNGLIWWNEKARQLFPALETPSTISQ